nr:MAG TPA: structural protein [Caudoviricetes sp.]
MAEKFLANVGTALIFRGNEFAGVGNFLTENTFSFSASPNEVRGGANNPLLGRWFSDSTLNVTITNATFKLEYLAWSLGTTIEQGGTSFYESQDGEKVVTAGQIELKNKPAAFNGAMIGWYKKPAETGWSIGAITETGGKYYLAVSGAQVNDIYCIKYPYMDENARMIAIPADFNPDELHVVLLNDLYNADINTNSAASKVGRLITDIPRLSLDPSQDLTLNATSSAPTQLTGTALRYTSGESCESTAVYGTMTEQVYGAKWQDNVIALACENSDMALGTSAKETAVIRVVYGGSTASQRKDNSNFTFTVVSGDSTVDNKGVVTAAATAGKTVISVTLDGYASVAPAYIYVDVN